LLVLGFFHCAIILSGFGAAGGARLIVCTQQGTKMTTAAARRPDFLRDRAEFVSGAVASLAIISHNRKLNMFNRILRVILLLLWLELGLLLILMPWSEVWDVNYFMYQYPGLALFVMNPYLRGMISGLGALNVLFALEAFRRRTATVVTRA
jgi:hypothetical protein